MRLTQWIKTLAVSAGAGLIALSAQAATFTYAFSGDFTSSRAVANLNGNAPIAGGTLSGFVTFDTNGSAFSIQDYHLETTQPSRFGGNLRSSVYDFDDQGISGSRPNAVTKTSVVTSTDTLSLIDYTSGLFSGLTWASSARRLDFTFDQGLLGAASIGFITLERFGSCSQSFVPFISNPCSLVAGSQNGVFTATLQVAPPPASVVPLPAGGVLLLSGLVGLGLSRQRRA